MKSILLFILFLMFAYFIARIICGVLELHWNCWGHWKYKRSVKSESYYVCDKCRIEVNEFDY